MNESFKNFFNRSKLENVSPSSQSQGVPQPQLELSYKKGEILITLSSPESLDFGTSPIKQIIEQRRTLRKYTSQSLSLAELSYLLWATQGVQKLTPKHTMRTVPSAGARHAFETYLLVNRVEGLAAGIYRYLAIENQLLPVNLTEGISDQVIEASCNQKFIGDSAVTFIWVAVTERMNWRYSERGYRYLFLDAGHVCQNLYLSAESISCGACAIDAYSDDTMNQLLKLDGEEQFVIYLATVGKREA
jgi:SagB-type dehydrogenase family enzyme